MTPDAVFSRILVPTDFSAGSERAWRMARRLAGALRSELVLVHVLVEVPPFFEGGPFSSGRVRELFATTRRWTEEQLEQRVGEARAAGHTARAVIRAGAPHAEIVAAVRDEQADLVVLGTQGRGGIDRALLGSVADRVIRTAPCPVLAVREPE